MLHRTSEVARRVSGGPRGRAAPHSHTSLHSCRASCFFTTEGLHRKKTQPANGAKKRNVSIRKDHRVHHNRATPKHVHRIHLSYPLLSTKVMYHAGFLNSFVFLPCEHMFNIRNRHFLQDRPHSFFSMIFWENFGGVSRNSTNFVQ